MSLDIRCDDLDFQSAKERYGRSASGEGGQALAWLPTLSALQRGVVTELLVCRDAGFY